MGWQYDLNNWIFASTGANENFLTSSQSLTNNNQSNKGVLELCIKNNIPVLVKPEQTFTRNDTETIFVGWLV